MEIAVAAPQMQGIVLGLLSLPICLWVAYTDLSVMKIRNEAVLALLALFAVGGFFVLPLEDWAWRWTHFAVVLLAGFAFSSLRMLGAGDAKFMAAMAPFVALPDANLVLLLMSGLLLLTFALHRAAGALEPVRAITPGWESWKRPEEGRKTRFPMGITLAATHLAYHGLAAANGL
ncbi:prepilin peptidase [Jannaschia sp. W003]|uniref:prepilin peptidase n=1 Tax=Jannaschia sp. W003 TaxID=2867012 RepID=UPI0021A305E9|nr:prepilin peptidase [Jannaschia sp. W003]UWQ22912.1 prepilin peptidase [Jannaschia sp. W003]